MNYRRNLSVYGPVVLLLIIGAAAYIITVKLTTPKVTTLSAQPSLANQSTDSAQSSDITMHVDVPASSQVSQWQQSADEGQQVWRLDPLQAAQQLSLAYGFDSNDQFSLTQSNSSSAPTVQVNHHGQQYQLTMYQPGQTGGHGVWAIQSIAQVSP